MKTASALLFLLFVVSPLSAQQSLPAPWKHQDIGAVQTPGTAKFAAGVFTLQGTLDIWNMADGCQLMWQPCHGDVEIMARVTAMQNPGNVGHAKASLCIRESLDADARSVTLCVTAVDGTQFLYREKTGGLTVRIYPEEEAKKNLVPRGQFPCWLKLVRHGNEFRGYESSDGEKWQLSAQFKLDLAADTVVGLAASSHKTDVLTTATFDHVQVSQPMAGGQHKPGKDAGKNAGMAPGKKYIAQLTTMAIDGTDKRIVYQGAGFEAPNWSRDGKWLVINSHGGLWRVAAEGGKPEPIAIGDVKGVNNDHVLSPDGKNIYFSASGHLYAVPFEGGTPRRISNDQAPERQFQYFLHGVSPDDKPLAYVGAEAVDGHPFARLNLYTIPVAGGPDMRLSDRSMPEDGPEYTPDGKWIYFNSELNAKIPGHAQCYRMKPDGTGIEQLTHDERVNWFPHISPDGKWIVYISFPPGTVKHPANKDVILRRMRPDGSERADLIAFNGGQGTINVNSWASDSRHFAFVVYTEADKAR